MSEKRENKFVKDLIARMTLEQKIGAMLTLGFAGTVPGSRIYDFVTKYHCGGLRLSCDTRIFGNYVDPKSNRSVVQVAPKNGVKYATAPECTASE